jgi:hypothetical protein
MSDLNTCPDLFSAAFLTVQRTSCPILPATADTENRVLGNADDVVGVNCSTELALLTTDGKLKGNQALQNRNNERRWDFPVVANGMVCVAYHFLQTRNVWFN